MNYILTDLEKKPQKNKTKPNKTSKPKQPQIKLNNIFYFTSRGEILLDWHS